MDVIFGILSEGKIVKASDGISEVIFFPQEILSDGRVVCNILLLNSLSRYNLEMLKKGEMSKKDFLEYNKWCVIFCGDDNIVSKGLHPVRFSLSDLKLITALTRDDYIRHSYIIRKR